jgi:putative membrane protein
MGFLIRLGLNALALLIVSTVIPGIEVRGVLPALSAAFFLGIVNAVLRPVLVILTLPLTILTLGLFIPLINAFLLKLVSLMIRGFEVHGFWSAVFESRQCELSRIPLTSDCRTRYVRHRHRHRTVRFRN